MTASNKMVDSLRIFASDVARGLFEVTHNGFAMLGLAVMFAAVTLVVRPEVRELGESQLVAWLQSRQAPVDEVLLPTLADTKPATQRPVLGSSGKKCFITSAGPIALMAKTCCR